MFNSPIVDLDKNHVTLNTSVSVGKSYKSKGWQLSKDAVYQLFPVEKYLGEYRIIIDDIESKANLNTQFRLFYKSDELSNYLEDLYHNIPKEKVPARIVFEESYFESHLDDFVIKKQEDLQSCIICGNKYNSSNYSLDVNNKFPNFCPNCIEKIIMLEKYNFIKNSSLSNFIKKEFYNEKMGDNDKLWELWIEYGFLIPFGALFKFNGNKNIERIYSKYLSNEENSKNIKKRNRNKILDIINDESVSERLCSICNNILVDEEVDKCDDCRNKSLATDYLKLIATKVSYKKSFSKLDLMNANITSLEVKLFVDKLTTYNLIIRQDDNSYKLNEVSYLNSFIKKYSDSPYELQINYMNNNSEVPRISRKDLGSEKRLDDLINWDEYCDYIAFKQTTYGLVSLYFMKDGIFMHSKKYGELFGAKRRAVHYLISLGKIDLVDDEDIRLEIK